MRALSYLFAILLYLFTGIAGATEQNYPISSKDTCFNNKFQKIGLLSNDENFDHWIVLEEIYKDDSNSTLKIIRNYNNKQSVRPLWTDKYMQFIICALSKIGSDRGATSANVVFKKNVSGKLKQINNSEPVSNTDHLQVQWKFGKLSNSSKIESKGNVLAIPFTGLEKVCE